MAVASAAVAATLFTGTVAAPPPTAASTNLAAEVIAIAKTHLGAPWVFGATGPRAFDCSGLVYSVFRQAGLLNVIGGTRTVTQMWSYFAARGQASRTNGQPGDLVVFGNGQHVGIYLGNSWVISTLVSGVGYSTLSNTIPGFTTFLHTHLSGASAKAAPRATTRETTVFLNFRSGPGTNYGIRAVLPPWFWVTVIGSARDAYGRVWDEVRLGNGAVGWVASWYLR